MPLLYLLPVALLATLPSRVPSLEVADIHAVWGAVQPNRSVAAYFPPFDNLCYRFQVGGLKTKDGRLDVEVATRLLNAKGKLAAFKVLPFKDFPIGGSRPATLFAHLPLTDSLTPGDYSAEVTVTDNVTGASEKFERQVVLKAPEFAVVGLAFSYDPEGKIPAPARIQAGQRLSCRTLVIGFDDSQRRVDVSQKAQIVAAESGAVLVTNEAAVRQPVVPQTNSTITFDGSTPVLLEAGKYLLRLTLTDNIGGRTIQHELEIEVTPP